MLNLINCSIDDFKCKIADKKLFVFGCGRALQIRFDLVCGEKKIEGIIDNNEKLHNTMFCFNGQNINIMNIDDFIHYITKNGKEDIVLWISPTSLGYIILKQLDEISELDGIDCFLTYLLLKYPTQKEKILFSQGDSCIPKKIHYCWVGGSKLPSHLQEYVDSWHRLCPDYEIICWDENNYDFSKNEYMKEAYDNKAWGFVPDYARLDIIYQHGGIYLDTDVELTQRPDVLLKDRAFFGYTYSGIAIGAGFGAEKNNPFIKQLRDAYDGLHFMNKDGSLNKYPCIYYQHPVFKQVGFEIKNKYQKKDGIVLYPEGVIVDLGLFGNKSKLVDNYTIMLHHSQASWQTEEIVEAAKQLEKNLAKRLDSKNDL